MSVMDKLGFGPKRVAEYKEPDEFTSYWLVTVTPNRAFLPDAPARSVVLTVEQYERYLRWQNGEGYIQSMLPDLSIENREILMSGVVI